MAYLSEDVKITTAPPTATGTTTITGSSLDMTGFDGAVFVIRLGTPATNSNIRIQQCDTASGTYADLTGTLVGNNATDTPLIVDINRPAKNFLKYQVTRGTGTTIDTVCITQYRSRSKPCSQPTNTQLEKYQTPAEGTA